MKKFERTNPFKLLIGLQNVIKTDLFQYSNINYILKFQANARTYNEKLCKNITMKFEENITKEIDTINLNIGSPDLNILFAVLKNATMNEVFFFSIETLFRLVLRTEICEKFNWLIAFCLIVVSEFEMVKFLNKIVFFSLIFYSSFS